jgi:hypothetical protein
MSEYIGFVADKEKANFYFRFIPEFREFGMNFESVDVCGQMADMLKRE